MRRHWRSIRGHITWCSGASKLLDFTLDERRSGCRGLIKSVENVTDVDVRTLCSTATLKENMEKPVYSKMDGKYREKMIKMTQMRAEGELDWEMSVGLVGGFIFLFKRKNQQQ